jgi:PKD repeat protein
MHARAQIAMILTGLLFLGLPLHEGASAPDFPIVINEVAWAGARWDYTAEWIELVNASGNEVDLAGWRLVSSDGAPDIVLRGRLAPLSEAGDEGYYLLERDNDEAVPSVPADLIYSGALTDRGETLSLYNSEGSLVDTANRGRGDAPTAWPAGTGRGGVPDHCSMERVDGLLPDGPDNWATGAPALVLTDGPTAAVCGTPKSKNSVLNLPLTAVIRVTPMLPEPGEEVTLDATATASASGEIVSYVWDFGDGTGGSGQTTGHRYEQAGEYTVTLTIQDDDGSQTEVARTLSVRWPAPPIVDFSVLTISADPPPRAGNPVRFQDESSGEGGLLEWQWCLGDGTTADDEHVTHSYEQAGTYVVALSVTDERGATAQQTQPVTIASRRPVAHFSVKPEALTEGEPAVFDASASTDPDGSVVTYQWDFDGDGSIDVETPEALTTHSISTSGRVSPTLYVVDDHGDQSLQFQMTILVNARPTALFSVSSFAVMELEEIEFLDHSYDEDGTITTWQWDFADGELSVQTSPRHAFSDAGSYLVNLTVLDDAGGAGTTSAEVTVENLPPIAEVEASAVALETGIPFTFDASTARDPSPSGTIVRYEWDVDGDRAFDLETTCSVITYVYEDDGSHDVRVRVTDDAGDSAVSKPVSVIVTNRPAIVAQIRWQPTDPADGESVSFTALASDPDGVIVTWAWDLGDGTTHVGQTSSHVFRDDDTYTVRLVVTDDDGLASKPFSTEVSVRNSPPVAAFSARTTTCDAGIAVAFNARPSYDPSPNGHIAYVAWAFGDGTSCPGTPGACGGGDQWTPAHCYVSPGTYTVTLVVIDEQGAIGRSSRRIAVAD